MIGMAATVAPELRCGRSRTHILDPDELSDKYQYGGPAHSFCVCQGATRDRPDGVAESVLECVTRGTAAHSGGIELAKARSGSGRGGTPRRDPPRGSTKREGDTSRPDPRSRDKVASEHPGAARSSDRISSKAAPRSPPAPGRSWISRCSEITPPPTGRQLPTCRRNRPAGKSTARRFPAE